MVIPGAYSPLSVWLQYIESAHPKPIDLGLMRVRMVVNRLNLKLSCVKIIVGGTNGKGSTCSILESILLKAGYRIGLYTSPHLLSFNERARINGNYAKDQDLVSQFSIIEKARGNISLTYFEFTTLAILNLFFESDLDVVILEVGLGGRLDAVNCIDADCAIITNISLDHTDFLGNTLEKISFEKAHICRPDKPVICGDSNPPSALLDCIRSIGANPWLFKQDFHYIDHAQGWDYIGISQCWHKLARPTLRGISQLTNASTALAALEVVRTQLPISREAVHSGLAQVVLPGRFHIYSRRPMIILDVAHNTNAAEVLAYNLKNMDSFSRTHAVFGMLTDKNISGVVSEMRHYIDYWYCIGLTGPRGCTSQALSKIVKHSLRSPKNKCLAPVYTYENVNAGLTAALENVEEDDRIVVFGSFLTVAEVLR